MSRDEAIEAGAKALDPDAWELGVRTAAWHRYEAARRKAVAVIDAALPHLVPALKAAGLREWAKEIREWYPEGIFIPPTRERLREVHEYLVSTGGTLDAIAAHVMRIAAHSAERSADRVERGDA